MRKPKPFVQRVIAPANLRPVVPVLKVRATDRLCFVCASERPWGFVTHWTGKQTQPCIAHRAKCQHCIALRPKRSRGYLLAVSAIGKVFGFVDLTPQAFASALVYADHFGTLRGRWFAVERDKQSMRGQLIIETLAEGRAVPDPLPADQDPLPSLLRIWGLENAA
jgi:hypothetical protein